MPHHRLLPALLSGLLWLTACQGVLAPEEGTEDLDGPGTGGLADAGPGVEDPSLDPDEGEPGTGGADPDGGPAVDPDADGGVVPVDAGVPGLTAEYFVEYTDRVLERVEPTLDWDWKDQAPSAAVGKDFFSARWTGALVAPTSGTYQLVTESDDGVRVWVNGQLRIDDWNSHFVTRNTTTVELQANVPVALRVEYFESDLSASLRLLWSTAGLAEQVVPSSALRTSAVPTGLPGPKPRYSNPVVPSDCPDPGVLGPTPGVSGYHMVCTGGTFPIRRSRNLVHWQVTGSSVLPAGRPSWAANGNRNWAPELHRVGDTFVAHFTTVNASNVLSLGAATAPSVLGPYTPISAPLSQHAQGVIDSHLFQDEDGSLWLFYKIDGNSVGARTPIYVRRLEASGVAFAAGPVEVLSNDAATWEGGVIEAPWVVKRNGYYYLFYSGNVYDHRYRTGVARATSITGPYVKHGAPILTNNAGFVGPGHGSVVKAGAFDYFVYHAWTNRGDGLPGPGGRKVLVDRIRWENGWPVISNGSPSTTPQPWPGEAGVLPAQ